MSLTASLRGGLRKFEILLENKHMSTNDTQQASTPDADICGGLRTMSGQTECPNCGGRASERPWCDLCQGRGTIRKGGPHDIMRLKVTPPAPAEQCRECNGTGEAALNSGTLWPCRLCNGTGMKTPPAERPTPITDDVLKAIVRATRGRVGKAEIDHIAEDLLNTRRQLAEAREKVITVSDDLARQLAEARKSSVCLHEGIAASAHGWALKYSEAREQRDRLVACLSHLRERDWFRKGTTGPVTCTLNAEQVRAAFHPHSMDWVVPKSVARNLESRVQELESALAEIYHATDCTEWQFSLIEAVLPQKTAWPECSGDPDCCPENAGYGCCQSQSNDKPIDRPS